MTLAYLLLIEVIFEFIWNYAKKSEAGQKKFNTKIEKFNNLYLLLNKYFYNGFKAMSSSCFM